MTLDCGPDPIITVSLDWEVDPAISGDLGFLNIGPSAGVAPCMWWNSLGLPDWGLRYDYAPPSRWVDGNVLKSAVQDSSALVVAVVLQGSSLANLEDLKAQLRAVVLHQSYACSVYVQEGTDTPTIMGGPWLARPTLPKWGSVTPQLASLYVAQTVLTIPVEPTGAP